MYFSNNIQARRSNSIKNEFVKAIWNLAFINSTTKKPLKVVFKVGGAHFGKK